MPRKSTLRTMATTRWLRWAATRALCRAVPALARRWNFPVRSVSALDVAEHVFENRLEELRIGPCDEARVDAVLHAAMANDAGDTSTYPQHFSPVSSWVVTIDDCVIAGRTLSVLHGRDGALVARDEIAPNWNAAKPERLCDRAAEPMLHMATKGARHYFHFYSDDLVPLMHALALHGDALGPLRVVVPQDSPPFVAATLAALARNYPQVSVCTLARDERLTGVRTLWLSRKAISLEWMVVTRAQAEQLTNLLVAHYGLPERASGGRRIFVTRGSARLRRLLNEQAVVAALSAAGFETFQPASGNHHEQVEMFRNADVVVAVHGAALTNLLFCRPGTLVVELFAQDHVKSTYLWLAHCLGLRHVAVVGTPGDLNQGFSIEPAAVVAAAAV